LRVGEVSACRVFVVVKRGHAFSITTRSPSTLSNTKSFPAKILRAVPRRELAISLLKSRHSFYLRVVNVKTGEEVIRRLSGIREVALFLG
jgi:hypothetical protein